MHILRYSQTDSTLVADGPLYGFPSSYIYTNGGGRLPLARFSFGANKSSRAAAFAADRLFSGSMQIEHEAHAAAAADHKKATRKFQKKVARSRH